MNFATRLKQLRYESGLPQTELAEKLNITRSSLCNYELGRREPSLEILNIIADFFNVDIDYLVGKTDKTTLIIDDQEKIIMDGIRKLNSDGIEKLIERLEELILLDKYKKE